MTLQLKVCGMRDPSNIEALIKEVEPSYMGMIFYAPSPRYVRLHDTEVSFYKNLPIKKVGVFVNESIEKILECAVEFGLTVIQLHGTESPVVCKRLHEAGYMVWKVFGLKNQSSLAALEAYKKVVDAFLFDTPSLKYGGTGEQWNWKILEGYAYDIPFWLSGGLDVSDFEEAKKIATHLPLIGIDVNSKFELSPALKDIKKLKELKHKKLNK